jgi:hypothetical protein
VQGVGAYWFFLSSTLEFSCGFEAYGLGLVFFQSSYMEPSRIQTLFKGVCSVASPHFHHNNSLWNPSGTQHNHLQEAYRGKLSSNVLISYSYHAHAACHLIYYKKDYPIKCG